MSKRAIIVSIIAVLLGIISASILSLVWLNPLGGATLPESEIEFNPQSLEKNLIVDELEGDNLELLEDVEHTQDPTNGDLAPTQSTDAEINQSEPMTSQADENLIENNPNPVCNGPKSMSVLVLGIDEQAQSDAIRLVHIDFTQPSVLILSIPRDFYVPIVDMAEHGITIGRINATYGYGEKFNGRGAGLISLADNIKYNFGVTFEHYIVLNLGDIAKYIDRIGGVDLYLEKPVADGKLYFSAGDHHFNGETAVGFMRMRYFDDDFARVQRQSLVIKAFYLKAMQELNPVEQTMLVLEFILDKAIETDFAYRDISPLTCLARNINNDNIHFLQVSKDMYSSYTTSAGGNVLIPNETVVPYIRSIMDGTFEP